MRSSTTTALLCTRVRSRRRGLQYFVTMLHSCQRGAICPGRKSMVQFAFTGALTPPPPAARMLCVEAAKLTCCWHRVCTSCVSVHVFVVCACSLRVRVCVRCAHRHACAFLVCALALVSRSDHSGAVSTRIASSPAAAVVVRKLSLPLRTVSFAAPAESAANTRRAALPHASARPHA